MKFIPDPRDYRAPEMFSTKPHPTPASSQEQVLQALSSKKFGVFNQELIDRYSNEDGKAAINAHYYKLMLAVIGTDEPMKTLREDKWPSSPPFKRNKLRAEQRSAAAKLFNIEGGDDE